MTTAAFATGGDRTRLAGASLAATAVVTVLLAVVHWRVSGTTGFTALGAAEGVLLVLGDLLQLLTIAAFGIWLHRAYRNVTVLRSSTRYTPAAAVAFFYLPFVSLFLPQAILQEIWSKSLVDDPRARSRPLPRSRPPWFETWWYIFIAFSAAYNFGATLALGRPEDASRATRVLFLAAVFSVAVAILGLDLISRIDRRQQTSMLISSLPGVEIRPMPARERRSPLRDLLVPIVSMVEEEKSAPEEEPPPPMEIPPAVLRGAAASRTAAIHLGRWVIKPRIPPLRQFSLGSIFATLIALALQLMALFQVLYCLVGTSHRIDRTVENIYLISAFLGSQALLQYAVIIVARITWRFWDSSVASDEALQRMRGATLHATIIFGASFVLALAMPPKPTLVGLAAANVFLLLVGRAMRQVAFSVAWNRQARAPSPSPSGSPAAESREASPR